MTIHPYNQWPKPHRQLLQFTLVLLALLLLLFWFHIIPHWQVLNAQSKSLDADKRSFAKKNYPLDVELLQTHLDDCQLQLEGTETIMGLEKLSAMSLEKAVSTFHGDIITAYPADSGAKGETPENIFVNHANRIDFKDLFDRLSTSLADDGITITIPSLGLDEESPDPVYQQILKLWTVRRLTQLATQNHLKFEKNAENGTSSIRAWKVISYIMDKKQETPYLLEFPVRFSMTGTMESFLGFVKGLQDADTFLPVKRLIIHSLPPSALPPGETRKIDTLRFSVVASSFFKLP